MQVNIEIAQDFDRWNNENTINKALFIDLLTKILEKFPNIAALQEVELSIMLTSNDKIQKLNEEFRDKNAPTNVLSFPDNELNWQNILEFSQEEDYIYLGDIAYGYEIIAKEAAEKKISFLHHFCHLTIHAILHLLGFDHKTDEEAEAMEKLEILILKEFDIESPY